MDRETIVKSEWFKEQIGVAYAEGYVDGVDYMDSSIARSLGESIQDDFDRFFNNYLQKKQEEK